MLIDTLFSLSHSLCEWFPNNRQANDTLEKMKSKQRDKQLKLSAGVATQIIRF